MDLEQVEAEYLMGSANFVASIMGEAREDARLMGAIIERADDGDGFASFLVAVCAIAGIVGDPGENMAQLYYERACEKHCPSAALWHALQIRGDEDPMRVAMWFRRAISWCCETYGSEIAVALGREHSAMMDEHRDSFGALLAKVIPTCADEDKPDDEYLRSFLDGRLFFKCLDQFASPTKRDESSQNPYRGDLLELCAESFGLGFNPHLYATDTFGQPLLGPEIASIDAVGQRKKVFCLSSLDFMKEYGTFVTPNEEMLEFGTYAVLIRDPHEFLRRVEGAFTRLNEKCGEGEYVMEYDWVRYDLGLLQSARYDEFHKSPSYCQQNEFRISLDLSRGRIPESILEQVTDFARWTFPGKIELDTDPISLADSYSLEVGDLRDICSVMSTDTLVHGPLTCDLPDDVTNPIRKRRVERVPRPTFCRGVAMYEGPEGGIPAISKEIFFSAMI